MAVNRTTSIVGVAAAVSIACAVLIGGVGIFGQLQSVVDWHDSLVNKGMESGAAWIAINWIITAVVFAAIVCFTVILLWWWEAFPWQVVEVQESKVVAALRSSNDLLIQEKNSLVKELDAIKSSNPSDQVAKLQTALSDARRQIQDSLGGLSDANARVAFLESQLRSENRTVLKGDDRRLEIARSKVNELAKRGRQLDDEGKTGDDVNLWFADLLALTRKTAPKKVNEFRMLTCYGNKQLTTQERKTFRAAIMFLETLQYNLAIEDLPK
jgi:hypothetical protein